MRKAWLVALILLAACAQEKPLTAADLALPQAGFPGIEKAERVVLIVDDPAVAPERDAQDLRRLRMQSAARYEYRAKGAVLKVHIMLFVNEAAAQGHWKNLHEPGSLGTASSLDAGEEAWIHPQQAAVRQGRAIIETRVRGEFEGLAGFVRASAAHAASLLGELQVRP